MSRPWAKKTSPSGRGGLPVGQDGEGMYFRCLSGYLAAFYPLSVGSADSSPAGGALEAGVQKIGIGLTLYSMSFFHFLIFVRKVPKGATVLTWINL